MSDFASNIHRRGAENASDQKLLPYKGLKFRVQEFADVIFEFIEENGQIKALKEIDPSGEYPFKRAQ